MDFLVFALSAVLLSIERITYFWVWRSPASFHTFCNAPAIAALGEPLVVLQKLFYVFKALQLSVFIGWCVYFADGASLLPAGTPVSMAVGGMLIMLGQLLNLGVFYRLGPAGVFYGNKLGYQVSWCEAFPFSIFKHPQYVGALISIWGFFLVMRFPEADWIALPVLQTFYYALGAYGER